MNKLVRITLGTLLLLIAINAFGGGYYGMAGVEDISLDLLRGSLFKNYFIPSLFLFIVVGGSCLFSAVAVFRGKRIARYASLFCGIILILWIIIQVSIIGYVAWLQPAIFVAGIFIAVLAYLLPVIQER